MQPFASFMSPDQRSCTLVDQQAQTHTITLNNERFFLDGLPATVRIVGSDLHLLTDAGTICVAAQAFWHAFAGAEPTSTEAGLLLADSLMRVQALRHIQQLQIPFQQIIDQIQALGVVPFPSYHLNPFLQQALEAYDGTAETTQLLARILKQSEETITTWACALGKVAPLARETQDVPHGDPIQEHVSLAMSSLEASIASCHAEAPSVRLQWTADMEEQLIIAFDASQKSTIKDTIAEIAQQYNWPILSVQARVYKLKLNEKKRPSAIAHDRESVAPSQEDD